jgi:hypothetical protein
MTAERKARSSGGLPSLSPPAEKATARKDKARETHTGDRARNCDVYCSSDRAVGIVGAVAIVVVAVIEAAAAELKRKTKQLAGVVNRVMTSLVPLKLKPIPDDVALDKLNT